MHCCKDGEGGGGICAKSLICTTTHRLFSTHTQTEPSDVDQDVDPGIMVDSADASSGGGGGGVNGDDGGGSGVAGALRMDSDDYTPSPEERAAARKILRFLKRCTIKDGTRSKSGGVR
jgi:hypothetical protein